MTESSWKCRLCNMHKTGGRTACYVGHNFLVDRKYQPILS